MPRFVSALGPDRVATPDIRFHKMVPDFSTALQVKSQLDSTLDEGRTTVIYRLSYSGDNDEFYSSRQLDLREFVSAPPPPQKKGGNESYDPGEPRALAALSYELFSIPVSLLTSGQEFELGTEVGKIYLHSNSSRPGKGYP